VTITQAVLLAGAAVLAGIVNAIAGGGTLLTFPALLAAGIPAVTANATNTVALFPGQMASSWAYRSHLADERRRALVLAVPSLAGGLLGSILLMKLPPAVFERAVPWLIIFACAVLALQGQLKQLLSGVRHGDHPAVLWLIQLLVGVYGGYFGAGIGIIMLAAMGIFLPSSIQHANALKVLFSLLINGIAAFYFMFAGAVLPVEATLMAIASIVGGFIGAALAKRLPPAGMRGFSILVGLYAAVRIMLR